MVIQLNKIMLNVVPGLLNSMQNEEDNLQFYIGSANPIHVSGMRNSNFFARSNEKLIEL